MTITETYQEKYTRAKARVEELKAFYNHLIIYVIINLGIAGINYYGNQFRFPWFLFPLLGWGIGIASHAVSAFRWNPLTSKNWEERKLQEIMGQEERNNLK